MREYIHLFENSDLRDDYENGSDYTEPYVSYTPIVIDGYEAQFNGETVNKFKVEKIQGGYKISVHIHEIEEVEVLTNSDSFYLNDNFIFPEDLNLTEESTEFTFDEITYYLEYDANNTWNVYEDSEHTQRLDLIFKFNIVSIPSSNTDFVHYNKIPPAKSIYAKIVVKNGDQPSDTEAHMRREISSRNDIFEKIIVDGNEILFNNVEPTRKEQDDDVYYTFSSEGIHNIEYVLKDEYAGIMPGGMIPSFGISFNEITLPKGIYKIESGAFRYTNYTGNYLNLNIPDTINEVGNNAVACIQISQEVTDLLLSINPNAISSDCK